MAQSGMDATDAEKVRPIDFLTLAGLFALTACLVAHFYPMMPDDALIYLRISKNLATGHGWAFNQGFPVDAATSPFFTIFVALMAALRIPGMLPVIVASFLGIFAFGAMMYWQSRYLGGLPAVLLSLAAGCSPSLLITIGMEPAVFLSCIAAAAIATQKRSFVWAGVFSGFAALGRPEGVAMLPLVLLTEWLRHKQVAWKSIAACCVVVAPWIFFSIHEFGSVVPHTMKVKAIQATLSYWNDQWYRTFLNQLMPPRAILLLLACVGAVRALADFQKRPFLALLIGFGTLQVVGYSLLRAPSGYTWYYAVGDMAELVSAMLGLCFIVQWCSARFAAPAWSFHAAVVCIIAIYSGLVLRTMRTYSPEFRMSPNYKEAGEWLKSHANDGDWVAASEVGYISYYSGLNVRDVLGLLEPSSVLPLSQHRWDWWYTGFQHPRFIIRHPPGWMGEPDSSEFPWSTQSEQTFEQTYAPVFQSGKVEIFEIR
jgi:hypothetical protein